MRGKGVLVAISLVSGVIGALLRAALSIPAVAALDWASQASGLHSALMVCGF